MAERKIEVRVATVGADQAAAEVRKVEAGNKALASSANTVSVSSANMRMGLMNVGYQVQDFAVQVASGTSASRAFAQQAPQLLSSFGLLGVAAGTAVALGAPLAGQLLGFEEAADKAGPAFDDLAERMGKAAAAKAKLETSQWVETLSSEEVEIRKQNEALDRNRRLLESKLSAQAKLDAANADKEIAEIDADNTLSEEEKIKRKAEVREKQERKKIEDQVNNEGRAVAADEVDAKAKAEEAKRLAEDAARISAEKAATEKELEEAERRERLRAAAKQALPQAREKLSEADKKEFIWGANPLRSDEDKAAARDEAESARRNVENLENQATADPGNAVRAASLRAKKQALEAAEAKARKEAEKAGIDAERMGLDAASRREGFEFNKDATTKTYQAEAAARRIRTDQQIKQARDERMRREQEESLSGAEDRLNETARGDSMKFRNAGRNVGGDLGKTLESIGDKMADGTNEEEIAKLSQQFIAATQGLGGATIAAMQQMISNQEAMAKQITIIETRIKRMRDGK